VYRRAIVPRTRMSPGIARACVDLTFRDEARLPQPHAPGRTGEKAARRPTWTPPSNKAGPPRPRNGAVQADPWYDVHMPVIGDI